MCVCLVLWNIHIKNSCSEWKKNSIFLFKWLNTTMEYTLQIYWQCECHFECMQVYHVLRGTERSTAKINKMSNNVAKAIYISWIGFHTFKRDLKPSNHSPILIQAQILCSVSILALMYNEMWRLTYVKANLTTKSNAEFIMPRIFFRCKCSKWQRHICI